MPPVYLTLSSGILLAMGIGSSTLPLEQPAPGRITTADGAVSVQLTQEDLLWAARATSGEILSRAAAKSSPTDEADVLWTLTQRYVRWLQVGKTFSFQYSTRSFSQPINPKWASMDAAGCRAHPEACTPAMLERRQELVQAGWAELRWRDEQRGTHVVESVRAWAEGRLRNTVPRGTNFAVPSVSASHVEGTPGAVVIARRGGHWYISDPPATRWTADHVRVESADRLYVADTRLIAPGAARGAVASFFEAVTMRRFWRG